MFSLAVTVIKSMDRLQLIFRSFSDNVNFLTLMNCICSLHMSMCESICFLASNSTKIKSMAMANVCKLLLLLAGDVERNPGPPSELNTKHVHAYVNICTIIK